MIAASAASTAPAGYTWEASSEQIAARYGLPVEAVVRFDLNTSPTPPALAARILAAGRFERPLSEYPPADYRRLAEAAATAYGVGPDEILIGAGADEVLDLAAKAFLSPGGTAVIATPTYSMYRVVSEQRGGRVVSVPRRPAAAGHAIDVPATRAAARTAQVVWLCSPNNPTALAEPEGAIETLLDGLAADADAAGREPPAVILDEAYAEFAGQSLLPLRDRYRRLVVIRTASKAYALAGLRVGFAVARPETLARIAPYRPPGSVSVPSSAIVTEALGDPATLRENVERIARERARLGEAFAGLGWPAGPSVTNFLLVGLRTPHRSAAIAEALQRRGLVPRTFEAGHPLAEHLRFTVRSADENGRLVQAAREIATEVGR